ncbi:hypothetical protein PsorP6_007245 [Peronosclerospora sorghi]|uniref:Uncharacterized protein n=1 Tax=Peronosclerospora sorghi TaxID=230839 RepID=A0ACC0WBF0_9STRA|nr:hypothetical protein PsorP6_007245 [Peronosclerospora sorghi]
MGREFFKELLDEQFYSTLTTFVGYVRRQQILISEIKSQAKKLQDKHWESMHRTTRSIASQSASMSSRNNRAVLHRTRGGLCSWLLRKYQVLLRSLPGLYRVTQRWFLSSVKIWRSSLLR